METFRVKEKITTRPLQVVDWTFAERADGHTVGNDGYSQDSPKNDALFSTLPKTDDSHAFAHPFSSFEEKILRKEVTESLSSFGVTQSLSYYIETCVDCRGNVNLSG